MTLPGTLPFTLGGEISIDALCDQIWAARNEQKLAEERIRQQQPLARVWDAEWDCQFVLGNEYSAKLAWISNDSGPAQTEIPFDSHVARWVHDHQGRIDRGEGRNVFLTVDYCGARWSGMMDKYSVEQRSDGDTVLVIDWLSDYEKMKWYSVWSNPFLPAAFQFPRAFMLAGPVTWILKIALFLQLFREHNPLITIPDDPMKLSSWFTSLDQSNWPVVVKPTSFLEAMASGVVWGIVFSRWKTWHEMAHAMLEDAELSVVCRRYLEGDELPWPGADLRFGTLVVDIVDKSGILAGTSHGGGIFEGLRRTVLEFADDFIDSTLELIQDAETPVDYFRPNHRLTTPEKPYVIFREGETSPIQTSAWINSPAKGIQVNVGGHSMPGINESISASIQAAGDIVGNLAQIGGLGGTIDTILQPIYEDTILAWWSVKSLQRAQHSGWDRLFEYFQDPSGKAYTIASLMVLRAGFWATKTTISWEVDVADGRPFLVGDNGVGHFFLDDRIGLILNGDETIHMDRCRKIELSWADNTPPEWKLTVGDDRVHQDPAQRAWGRLENLIGGLKELGVW